MFVIIQFAVYVEIPPAQVLVKVMLVPVSKVVAVEGAIVGVVRPDWTVMVLDASMLDGVVAESITLPITLTVPMSLPFVGRVNVKLLLVDATPV